MEEKENIIDGLYVLSGGIKKIDYRIGKMYMFDAKKFFNNVSRGIVSR